MSARVELVRRAHEALNNGDVEALVAECDPAFVLDMSDRVLNPEVYEGYDGIQRFLADVHEAWEAFTWEPEELMESADLVLVLIRSTGLGWGSGIELDRRAAMLWSVPDDRAASLRFFRDRTAAREAAGLGGAPRASVPKLTGRDESADGQRTYRRRGSRGG